LEFPIYLFPAFITVFILPLGFGAGFEELGFFLDGFSVFALLLLFELLLLESLLLELLSELLSFELSLFELLLVLAVAVGAVSELDPAFELALELLELEPESESELVSLFALVPEVLSSVALSFDSDSELSATTGSLAEAISALISDSSVAK